MSAQTLTRVKARSATSLGVCPACRNPSLRINVEGDLDTAGSVKMPKESIRVGIDCETKGCEFGQLVEQTD